MKSGINTVKRWLAQMRANARFHGPRMCRRLALFAGEKWVNEGVIIAGPFVGELGFEIGEWVPHIKGLVDRLKCKAHVFTRKGHEILYPFAENIHTFDFPGDHSYCNWLFNPPDEEIERCHKLEEQVREYAGRDEFCKEFRILEVSGRSRTHRVFRDKAPLLLEPPVELTEKWRKTLPSTTKVVLTYRGAVRGSERNSNMDTLRRAADLAAGKEWTPVVVGKVDEGYPIPEVKGVNLINRTSLADLVAIYGLSCAVVGSSTGIIHLAAACGVPHITWGSTYRGDRVIVRYKEEWNLNKTWVRFISKDWDVNVEDIAGPLIEAVEASADKRTQT